MAYSDAVTRGLRYLSERVLDPAWVAEHEDVAYYFKAPLAFLESSSSPAPSEVAAAKVLEAATRYLEKGGADSENPAYAGPYPHYPWMWMCWAATRLGRNDLAQQCYERLYAYVVPSTCAGLVTAPFGGEGASFEADLFATAEVVKVSLLVGHLGVAEAAADTLVQALEYNSAHMREGRFYLRWGAVMPADGCSGWLQRMAAVGTKHLELVQEDDPLHCVMQGTPGQLYFMMAFPAMVLLELSKMLAEEKSVRSSVYRSSALKLLEFLKGCVGVFESPMAHKVAIASAMAGDAETARRIADFLVSQQQPAGCFVFKDSESMDAVDQTAEILVWLLQVQKELAKADLGGA
jgi:hypothetical protein